MAHSLDDQFGTADEAGAAPDATGVEHLMALANQAVVLVSSVALLIAAFVLTYSVVTRYFLHLSTDWQDEVSVFLIVGAVFMSAAAVQARRGHVAIEALSAILPPRVNYMRLLLVDIATLVFCVFFSWKAVLLLHEAIVEGYRSSSTWQPPLWIPYSLMTAGMILLSAQLVLQIAARFIHRGKNS